MKIPLFMQIGLRERETEPLEVTGAAAGGLSSPPPLPQPDTPSGEAASSSTDEASKAPTLRPPPASADAAPSAASSRTAEDFAERQGLGFTSVVRHLSLRGWLRWIYSNRSNATLRVRTPDGGSGNIWCVSGRIVDAEWGRMSPEDALQEMLGLASGAVTIDFDPIDRPRRIAKPMQELLFASRSGSSPVADVAHHYATLAASPSTAPTDQAFRNSAFIQLGKEAQAVLANARRSWPRARRLSRTEYIGGGLLLAAFILVAFAVGHFRGTSEREEAVAEPKRVQQTKSLLPPPSPSAVQPVASNAAAAPRDLPVIPFVALETEPINAEIWLDQSFVGLGRLELAAIPDGAMHELRFVAAGYETRNLYFVGAPPAGRVRLERAVDRAPALAPPAPSVEPTTPDPEEGARPRSVLRRRAPVAPPPSRFRNTVEVPAPAAKAPRVKTAPQIQVIEARAPRVQVVD
jgi:hypothetical protein